MACNSINTTLELLTLAMLACLITAILCGRRDRQLDGIFLAVVCGHVVNTLGDLLAWRFAGQSETAARVLAQAGNTLTYLFIPLVSTSFLALVFAYATRRRTIRTRPGRVLAAAIAATAAASLVVLVSNPWTGLLYRIDEKNQFYWGTASSFLPDGAVLVQLLLFYGLLAAELRGEKNDRIWRALLCCLIPTAAIAAEILGANVMLLYPTLATSLLLLYFGREQALEETILRQEADLADSRAKLLLGQIQPHFIFNSLLAIQQLCEEDPQRAEQAVSDFSQYLRGNLDAMTDDRLVPFERELAHIKCYLALETADPASRIRVRYELGPTDFFVPQLTIQPLVENAVRHGLKPKPEGGTVTIRTAAMAEGWTVTVTDDGVGFTAGGEAGVGLQNIQKRLAAQCGGTLHITSGPTGTRAEVFIPRSDTTDGKERGT